MLSKSLNLALISSTLEASLRREDGAGGGGRGGGPPPTAAETRAARWDFVVEKGVARAAGGGGTTRESVCEGAATSASTLLLLLEAAVDPIVFPFPAPTPAAEKMEARMGREEELGRRKFLIASLVREVSWIIIVCLLSYCLFDSRVFRQ